MTRTYLNPEQELRAQQVRKAHTNMRHLEEATAEAIKYHDKYLNALETVMTCLLDSSDTWEDVRTHLIPEGTAMDAIAPSGGRLAAAYNTWKVSKELRTLRDQMEALQAASKAGRQHTKKTQAHVEKLTKVAKKCAEVNSCEHEIKIEKHTGKSKEKLLKEKQKENASMDSLDQTVVHEMKSTGTWWSVKLVSCCDEMYVAFTRLGHRTVACFNDGAAPLPTLPYGRAEQVSGMPTSGYSAPPTPNAPSLRGSMNGAEFGGTGRQVRAYYIPSTAGAVTTGVPLQPDTRVQNIRAL